MKIVKILLAGLMVTAFGAVLGALTCGGVFSWVYKLEPTNVWKPMEGAPGLTFYIVSFLLNVILAVVYSLILKGLPGKNRMVKGLVFGLLVWAVGILPGMFCTYYFMTVATGVVIYLTILGLVEMPIKGWIIAAIYGE